MKYLYLFILSINLFVANSQLQTFLGAPHLLISPNFLGPNYTISNVIHTGSIESIGSFDATITNIGLTSGVIMTSGTILNNESGPIGPNNMPNAGWNNVFGGDAQLSSIAGNNTYNAAVLEFDIISTVDSFSLKYVFGSEEYPEFAPPNNTTYNDVFGIFISGPGIIGVQNIAKLPNGNLVSINNINAITNASYYNNNGDGNSSPQNSFPQYIQYDGYTKTLNAIAMIQIGQIYHIKIAIADVGDGIFDSGIFLASCETCAFYADINSVGKEANFVYPNPANDHLNFNTSLSEGENVSIFDITGKMIKTITVSETLKTINIHDLSDGTYFMKISNGISSNCQKIVVQH